MYMSEAVMNMLGDTAWSGQGGYQAMETDLTILFSDIKGFTPCRGKTGAVQSCGRSE